MNSTETIIDGEGFAITSGGSACIGGGSSDIDLNPVSIIVREGWDG